jgi:hypothetical protein
MKFQIVATKVFIWDCFKTFFAFLLRHYFSYLLSDIKQAVLICLNEKQVFTLNCRQWPRLEV